MSDAEGGSRELVDDRRVAARRVFGVVALRKELEAVEVDCVPAEESREELVVGEVLGFGDDDASGVLEEFLLVPVGVDRAEAVDDAVVLAHEDRVDGRQTGLFGGSSVT